MRAEATSQGTFSGWFEMLVAGVFWVLHANLLPPWVIDSETLQIWNWNQKDAETLFMFVAILMACGLGFSLMAVRHVRGRWRAPAAALLVLNAISVVRLLLFFAEWMLT